MAHSGLAADGFESSHTIVRIVNDDMPFLVDSVTMALAEQGATRHQIAHPVMVLARDAAGQREGLGEGTGQTRTYRENERQGGTQRDRTLPTDTWSWDGRRWERVAADGPGPGDGYRLAYAPARRVTVLFGGETVTWDGHSWMRRTPTGATPAPRVVHASCSSPPVAD